MTETTEGLGLLVPCHEYRVLVKVWCMNHCEQVASYLNNVKHGKGDFLPAHSILALMHLHLPSLQQCTLHMIMMTTESLISYICIVPEFIFV